MINLPEPLYSWGNPSSKIWDTLLGVFGKGDFVHGWSVSWTEEADFPKHSKYIKWEHDFANVFYFLKIRNSSFKMSMYICIDNLFKIRDNLHEISIICKTMLISLFNDPEHLQFLPFRVFHLCNSNLNFHYHNCFVKQRFQNKFVVQVFS